MIRGSCLCGGILFEAESVPLITTCHCSKCRKSRGSAFSTTACVPISQFRFLQGEDLIHFYQPSAGGYSARFCRSCGSSAPWVVAERQLVLVPAGLLDGDPGVRPALHMFVGSKAPWWEIRDDLPQFAEWVPGYGPERLPSVAEMLAPVLERVAAQDRPLLIALAERLAAERYRDWAADPTQRSQRSGLLACADREEEIARRVESLYPAAADAQRDLLAKHPDLLEINRELFAGRPLEQQFAIQARGERLGAATWRSLAKRAGAEAERQTFLGCALLEEESAAFLESL